MAASSAPRKSAPRKPVAPVREIDTSEEFEYELESGETITLPRFDSVKPGVIRRIRKLSEIDQFFTVLETLADDDTIKIIDDLDNAEFQALQLAWFKHAGVNLGES